VKLTYAALLQMDEDEPIVCTKPGFEPANGDDEDEEEDEKKRKEKDEEDEEDEDDDEDDGEISALHLMEMPSY
jgi:hypothetical protein